MYNISIKNISWKSHSVNLPLWAGLISFDGWICEEVLSEVVDMWQLQDGLLTTNQKVRTPISILCILYNYVWLPDLYLAGDAPLSVALHGSLYGVHLIIFQNWCLWYDISQMPTLHSSLHRSLHKVDLICWKFDADCMLYLKCQPNSPDVPYGFLVV